MFNVWPPFLSDSVHVTFDVTPQETALVNKGTPQFVSSCLESRGISFPAVQHWTVTCVRQTYYGDYVDSPDWRARWDLAWAFEVLLANPVDAQIPFQPFPVTIESIDASSSADREPSMPVGPALIAACFEDHPRTEQEIEDVVSEWSSRYELAGRLRTRFNRNNGYLQVRILIDGIKFPEQIEALDQLNRGVSESGGITTWRGVAAAMQPKA